MRILKTILLFIVLGFVGIAGMVWNHEYFQTLREFGPIFRSPQQVFVTLTSKKDDIFNREFLETLKKVTDELFFMPEIDRSAVESLFTAQAHYVEPVEDGLAGGPIISGDLSYTEEELAELRKRIRRSSLWGRLITKDFKSAVIRARFLPGAKASLENLQKYGAGNIDIKVEPYFVAKDKLIVFAVSKPDACVDHEVMRTLENFEREIGKQKGVLRVLSLASISKRANAVYHEGHLKWQTVPKNRFMLSQSISSVEPSTGLLNFDCSVMPVIIFLKNHDGRTVRALIQGIKAFNRKYSSDRVTLRIGAGNVVFWAMLYHLFQV